MFRWRAVAILGVGIDVGKNGFAICGVDGVGIADPRGQ